MEQILRKLSEIEEEAQSIIQGAEHTKQQLSLDMEKQRQEYDRELARETEEQIIAIRSEFEAEKETRLKEIREKYEQTRENLDDYYEREHEALARELFQKVLNS